jgi:hypothetical protein
LPCLPTPPPSYPYRTRPLSRFPLGLQLIGPSKPGKLSDVADNFGAEPGDWEYILTWRRAMSEPEYGSSEETAKNAASPRKVMAGRPSSVGCDIEFGFDDELEGVSTLAAALPKDPWNWVDFFPHPTLMNPSAKFSTVCRSYLTHLLRTLQCVEALHGSSQIVWTCRQDCPRLHTSISGSRQGPEAFSSTNR